MNRGLYLHSTGCLLHLKHWENSTENFGVTIPLEGSDCTYKIYPWKNARKDQLDNPIGATCLAQW